MNNLSNANFILSYISVPWSSGDVHVSLCNVFKVAILGFKPNLISDVKVSDNTYSGIIGTLFLQTYWSCTGPDILILGGLLFGSFFCILSVIKLHAHSMHTIIACRLHQTTWQTSIIQPTLQQKTVLYMQRKVNFISEIVSFYLS